MRRWLHRNLKLGTHVYFSMTLIAEVLNLVNVNILLNKFLKIKRIAPIFHSLLQWEDTG